MNTVVGILLGIVFFSTPIVNLNALEPGGSVVSAASVEEKAPAHPPGWRSDEEVREDLSGSLSLDPEFWWFFGLIIVAAVLLVWLGWQQSRGGRFFGGQGGKENIEIVARRMLGNRHGVVCVRLRDREFLLGVGNGNISLISEWRTREKTDGPATAKSFEEQIANSAGGSGE